MTQPLEQPATSSETITLRNEDAPTLVVCIGSSAGGLEALQDLLGSLSSGLPITYVIAQHRSPDHDSPLSALLQTHTSLEVSEPADGTPLRPGAVFVAPPNTDVTVSRRAIVVSRPGAGRGPKPSIDTLFRSLAETWGESAVGIVLSGTGEDGAEGLRAIKGAGGLTIAQEPDTAKFPSMPRAAATTGHADVVLPPAAMGEALERVYLGDGASDSRSLETPDNTDGRCIAGIVNAVRTATGINFGNYKSSTLLRQIGRRQAITQVRTLAEYRDLIERDPHEAMALSRGMQVSVTAFFRDGRVWESLRPRIEEIVSALDPTEPFRAWVPGCATGEELYTVAMVAADALGRPADLARRLKIFGTDLDEDALSVARAATYRAELAAPIPPADAERWLVRHGEEVEIDLALRECAVIARHDVSSDPPFPRLHLITLRNILIYFTPPLQRRVLRLCNFALLPGGLLVLGESERNAEMGGLFEALDGERHVFERADPEPSDSAFHSMGMRASPAPVRRLPATDTPADSHATLRDELVRMYTPPSLVIDERDEVIEAIGDVTPWCWVSDGRYSSHAVALVRDELRPAIRSMLVHLRHGDSPVVTRSAATADGPVTLTMRRIGREPTGLAVVSFEPEPGASPHDGPPAAEATEAPEATTPDEQEPVVIELDLTQRALEATFEELAASNQDLLAMNEELQASTEELQASTEELGASNEELEAANEELATLNQELQVRGAELVVTNTDLENVQASLNSGIVLLDTDLRVRRFNQLAVRLFALIDSDIGRSLTSIPATVRMPGLEARLREVIAGGSGSLMEIRSGATEFLVQFQPNISHNGELLGAIVVSTDVTELAAMRRQIAESLQDFENVANSLREVVWRRDGEGRLTFVNIAVEEVLGLKRSEVETQPDLLLAAIHPDDRERVRRTTASSDGRWEIEYRLIRPDGSLRWVQESALVVPPDTDADQRAGYMVGTILDITGRHDAESRANSRDRLLGAVFDAASSGLLVVDSSKVIRLANQAFATISGYDRQTLVGMATNSLMVPIGDDDSNSLADGSLGLRPGLHERRLLTRNGNQRWVTVEEYRLAPSVEDDSYDSVLAVVDQSQAREEQTKLSIRARFDQMTGLTNRTHFRDMLATLLRASDTSLAVLWVDLDNFKEVNDRFGHHAGDMVLFEIATRLKSLVRRNDVVGRIGGDEFAVLLTELDEGRSPDPTALRVIEALRRPVLIGSDLVFLSASVGVAVSPDDGETCEVLLEHADMAMYEAKELGRDRYVYFSAEMNERVHDRAESVQRLRVAIREGEFQMHYQPILDTDTGGLRAAEALLRWTRDGRAVNASEFITLAEESSQIRALGAQVFRLVPGDLQTLATATGGSTLPVGINLSADQLDERALFDLLKAWDIPGGFSRLIVEVTESSVLDRRSQAKETLALLRRLGASVSIDDFGTGYSNLSLLDRLRPDTIKLDSSLLHRARHDTQGVALLRASVELARSLGAELVMEGVETEADRRLTLELGVTMAQGYFLARPMPIEEFVEFVRTHPFGTA